MKNYWNYCGFALVAFLTVAFTTSTTSGGISPPPNWKGHATGTTRPEGGVHVDELAGHSSHLGQFTGAGFHILNPNDFTFVGQANWTASNGDSLAVTYTGQVFLSG